MYMLSIAADMIELAGPLLSFGLTVFIIYKIFTSLFGSSDRSSSRQRRQRTYTQRNSDVHRSSSKSYVKNSRNSAVDQILADYFRNNVSLILVDDVSLSTQGGTYTTVDNLYVSYKDEKVCQMKEFKGYYPDSYNKVIASLSKLAKKGGNKAAVKEEKKKEEKKAEPQSRKLSPAESFIEEISALNNDLYNEEVTNGLYQTCDLLKQIDLIDKEDGEIDPKLNKLYEYYLPILVGILKDYKRLSDSGDKSNEFKKTETQLVKTIKLINEALKTICNSLHESDYMSLNADINTLQSLLKQDGLVETPFKGGSND